MCILGYFFRSNTLINILFLILALLFNTFFCKPLHSYSLDHYLQDLLEKNNQVQSYQAQKRQTKELLWRAKSDYMPQVNLDSQFGKENTNREYGDNTDMDRSYLKLKSTQLITDFGGTTARIAKAKTDLQESEQRLEMVRKNVLLEGISAYLQVLQAREKLHYAKRSEKNIQKQTGMEETLVRKGAGLSSDVLQVRAQLSGAKALRVRAEGDLETAMNRFQAIFHTELSQEELEALVEPTLSKDKIPATKEEAVQRALNNNPDLKVLKKELEVADKEVGIRKGSLFPKLNLFAEYEYNNNDSGIKGYRQETRAGIELTYNIFKSGGDWAAIKAAREHQTSVLKNLKYQNMQVAKQAKNDWNNLLIQTQNHELLQNQARIANEFLELAKKERKLGNRSLLDILSGETEYIQSVSESVAAAVSRKFAAYKLLYTTGDLSLQIIQ